MSVATPSSVPAGMPAPASVAEALAMRRAAESYLAAADPTALTAAELAGALIEMEQCTAIATAARAWFLGAFVSAQGPAADGDGSAWTWVLRKTGVTLGCAAGHVGWSRRVQATSVKDCALLCSFHHLVAVHRWGWKLIVNLDGTTTAWSPDRSKVLHSHGPPPRPG
jgi:hypothetical protein